MIRESSYQKKLLGRKRIHYTRKTPAQSFSSGGGKGDPRKEKKGPQSSPRSHLPVKLRVRKGGNSP